MATATIVRVWQNATHANIAALVNEGGSAGRVEYIAHVPLEDLAGLTTAEKKAALVAAVKAVRDTQLAVDTDLTSSINGTVTV